jgi:hypothetical protein
MHPTLKPAMRRSWRDRESLQFGLDPAHAVVLGPLDEPASRFLRLLDGTRGPELLRREAEGLGLAPERVERLLDALADGGVLDDADSVVALDGVIRRREETMARLRPDLASLSVVHREPGAGASLLAARRAARVQVRGAGRVGAAVAAVLAAAGVGRVDVVDGGQVEPWDTAPAGISAAQVGERRATAARAAMRRAWPDPRPSHLRPSSPLPCGPRPSEPRPSAREEPASPAPRPAHARVREDHREAEREAAAEDLRAPAIPGAVPGAREGGEEHGRRSGHSHDHGYGHDHGHRLGLGHGHGHGHGHEEKSGRRTRRGGRGEAEEPPLALTVFAPRDGLGGYAPDPREAEPLLAAGIPHLYAGVLEGMGSVGPLVVPGRTGCAGCLDARRADEDPAWPRMLAQLRSGRPPGVVACDVALATLVAGLAAAHALAFLDWRARRPDHGMGSTAGEPAPGTGSRTEFSLARLGTRVEEVAAHPRCRCGAARREERSTMAV